MSDSYVQLNTDGAGKKVDTGELTRADGTVVERQRVVIADPSNPEVVADLDGRGQLPVSGIDELIALVTRQNALLTAIAVQLGADPDAFMGA